MNIYNEEILRGPLVSNARISLNRELIPNMKQLSKLERTLFEMYLARINPVTDGNLPTAKVQFELKYFKKIYSSGITIPKIKEALANLEELRCNGTRVFYRCYMPEGEKSIIMDLHYAAKHLCFDLHSYISYKYDVAKELKGKAYMLYVEFLHKTSSKNTKLKIKKRDMISILDDTEHTSDTNLRRDIKAAIVTVKKYTNMRIKYSYVNKCDRLTFYFDVSYVK